MGGGAFREKILEMKQGMEKDGVVSGGKKLLLDFRTNLLARVI